MLSIEIHDVTALLKHILIYVAIIHKYSVEIVLGEILEIAILAKEPRKNHFLPIRLYSNGDSSYST